MKITDLFLFFVLSMVVIICGCSGPGQITTDKANLIGSWQNQAKNDVIISFVDESVVEVSPSFGCWILNEMGKETGDFICEYFTIKSGVWSQNTKGSTFYISINKAEVVKKTITVPNSYYMMVTGTLHGICPSSNLPCSRTFNVTIPFQYDPAGDSISSTELPPFKFIRVSNIKLKNK